MQRIIDSSISSQAQALYKQYVLEDKFKINPNSTEILGLLKTIANDQKISPDDWAIVQESLESDHPCLQFFIKNRDAISRQKIFDGKKYTAVPIITFTYHGEAYVLLMKNIGLANSSQVQKVQWTAHGVRVDSAERELLQNDDLWNLYEKVSSGDERLTYLISAAARRVNGLGLKLTSDDIKHIHPIDRNSAGYIEMSPDYRTEYFSIDLGEKNPEEILKACQSNDSTRYAKWTRCFKLSDLKASVKTDSSKQKYVLNYQDEELPVRDTTWFFIMALQLLKEIELQPESIIKDPWQLRNVNSLELAMNWILRRMDEKVQITIFSEKNNKLTSAKIHAYAAKAKLNEENFAFTTLKPERLVLLSLIANITVMFKIKDSVELEKIVDNLYSKFFEVHPNIINDLDSQFANLSNQLSEIIKNHFHDTNDALSTLSADDQKYLSGYKQLLATIKATPLDDRHKIIYNLTETDEQIAHIICLYKKYNEMIVGDINNKIRQLLEIEISNRNQIPLEVYSADERLCFGITGPVASGKSVSEGLIRSLLGGKSAAFVGSDEWNIILSKCLELDNNFIMQRGKLTLAEAWYVKVLIWDRIKELEQQNKVPNTIQETCDPNGVYIPETGKTHIYINTADPSKAADRVKERGDKSGRYVSASVASGSYKWPWLNFVSVLKKIHKDANKDIEISVIDTDVMYAANNKNLSYDKRMRLAEIATLKNGELTINNIIRFLSFIERSYRVNSYPRNAHEIWQKPKPKLPCQVNYEMNKLFDPEIGVSLKFKGIILTPDALNKLVYQASYIIPKALHAYSLLRKNQSHEAENTINQQPTLLPGVKSL